MKRLILALLCFVSVSVFADPPGFRNDRGNPTITKACHVPIALPSSGSMGANGALTLTTGLYTTYSGGIWLHFPAGAVYSGSAAGFYWTVMSNTTTGTVYNSTFTPGTSAFCSTGTTTAVVDAGPGAYTSSTSEIDMAYFTIPANTMGPNGWAELSNIHVNNNSGNNKTHQVRYSGTGSTIVYQVILTTGPEHQSNVIIRNQNATNKNLVFGISNTPYTAGAGTPGRLTVNTTADTNLVVTGTKANAGDYIILDGGFLRVWYAK